MICNPPVAVRVLAVSALMAVVVTGAFASVPVSGTIDATFINPSPGTATTSGVGTNHFKWGVPSPTKSELKFVEYNPFNSQVGQAFKLGKLKYYNGSIQSGTGAESVDLRLQIDLTLPTSVSLDESFQLELINTPNVWWSWTQSADIVKLPDVAFSKPFIYNGYNYCLELIGFGNVDGDCYLTSNNKKFHVREGKWASAELYGIVHCMEPVPEPFTLGLGALGIAAAAAMRRRRK